LLCLLAFTDTFGYSIVVPLLPFAARDFGASDLAIGVVFASYSLCQLVAAPVIGTLSDRHGRRPLLLISQTGSAAGFALMIGAGSIWPLLLSRVIDGVTSGNISLVYAAVLDGYPQRERARQFSYLSSATGLGILAGLGVSSLLARFGLGAATVAALALCLAGMLLTWRIFPETAARRPAGMRHMGRWIVNGAGGPAMRRVLAAKLAAVMGQTGFVLAFPLYLSRLLGYDATEAATLMTVLVAAGACFQVAVMPRLVDLLGEVRAALLGFGLLVAGGLVAAMAGTVAVVFAGGSLVLWGSALLGPSLTTMLAGANTTLDEGAVMGVNQSVASAGQMLGPPPGYGALAVIGAAGSGLLCAAMAALGFALTLRTRNLDGRA
jgi:DHA1 family tetracycline resistance protein-like MFS transporter